MSLSLEGMGWARGDRLAEGLLLARKLILRKRASEWHGRHRGGVDLV